MSRFEKIAVIRRTYNQWVANQTLEDYALRFTAQSARKWSAFRVANAALGGISFLALEAIGAAVTLAFGFNNAVAAILVVGGLIFLTGLPISYYAAKYGVDIDLLARGAGFGYLGSTLTSLIYASFTFIFFAIEAAILAYALNLGVGLPLPAGYLLSCIIIVPMVTHGITFIGRFQLWTQPAWLALQVLPLVAIGGTAAAWQAWTVFPGIDGTRAAFDIVGFGAASTVLFALIAQIGEQVDYLRFLPRDRRGTGKRTWWLAMLAAGPGWIIVGMAKMLLGSFLAVHALSVNIPAAAAADPTQMYLAAFAQLPVSADMALFITVVFVVIAQLKINVTNAYAGSIAWSNFFSRLTYSHPGRVVWLVFNVAIAFLLMQFGIYEALKHILGLYAVVAVAWVGALVGDLVVNKPLGLSPARIEFKRAHLYDINPVGVGATAGGTLAAFIAYAGWFGPALGALAPFAALAVAFVLAPAIALATGGRYYLARVPDPIGFDQPTSGCIVCEHHFEREDMARCPAYGSFICSLCCSLDARCKDMCKPHGRLVAQTRRWLGDRLPARLVDLVHSRIGHYLALMTVICLLLGGILALVAYQAGLSSADAARTLDDAFWTLFAILTIVVGVLTWLFVLAQDASRVAQEESRHQNALLLAEIEAHERTDAALQKAKEAAEAANKAKSRHMFGLAHELRTPLNAISGYAQLLERDPALPERRRGAVSVIKRSTDHLASLIESLLDISKIEAGRLQLSRDAVAIGPFLDEIVDMVRLQAAAKGLSFVYDLTPGLPPVVSTDEKRLRQILINLLSNAVKFTSRGSVALRVHWKGGVVCFEVADTGVGISPDDIQRIFEPFERGRQAEGHEAPGTGLGLTITKLLTKMLGGEIRVDSTMGRGTTFTVKLYLPALEVGSTHGLPSTRRTAYAGPRRSVLVVDDDADHRDLMVATLGPIGFTVLTATNGAECLATLAAEKVDLVLLDLSMPGLGGREVARAIHTAAAVAPSGERLRPRLLFVSANAPELLVEPQDRLYSDGTFSKPIDLDGLVERIGVLLALDWRADERAAPAPPPSADAAGGLSPADIADLVGLARIGHLKGLIARLDEVERHAPRHAAYLQRLRTDARALDFDAVLRGLDPEALAATAGPPPERRDG